MHTQPEVTAKRHRRLCCTWLAATSRWAVTDAQTGDDLGRWVWLALKDVSITGEKVIVGTDTGLDDIDTFHLRNHLRLSWYIAGIDEPWPPYLMDEEHPYTELRLNTVHMLSWA